MQPEQHVDIELVIHYQMLSSPAKHKAKPAKKAVLPEVGWQLCQSSLRISHCNLKHSTTISNIPAGCHRTLPVACPPLVDSGLSCLLLLLVQRTRLTILLYRHVLMLKLMFQDSIFSG